MYKNIAIGTGVIGVLLTGLGLKKLFENQEDIEQITSPSLPKETKENEEAISNKDSWASKVKSENGKVISR